MSARPSDDARELLAQVGWVRALALRVARDPHAADDLAQQTMLVALASGADRPRLLRAWLAAVLGNLERSSYRAQSRRARREQGAARPEVAPSTLELVERASTQRALVGALLELDEPYRSTLLLRFFEGRTPREIATRMNVPESTVATRTAEALERLRARLTRGGETPREWLPAILPLLRWPARAVPRATLQGALLVSTQAKLIFGGALLVAAVLASRALLGTDAPEPGELAPSGASVEDVGVPAPAVAALPGGEDSTRVQPGVPMRTEQPAAPATGMRVIRGRVIDLHGQPVAGVEVCRVGISPPRDGAHAGLPRLVEDCVRSDGRGEFEVEGRPPLRMKVRSERYTTVFEGILSPGDEQEEPVVVVAWRLTVGGAVVDEEGIGVEGALAVIVAPDRPLSFAGNVLGSSSAVVPETRSDAQGLFSFDDAAELEGARLHVEAPGFLSASLPVPEGGGSDLRVVLRRAQVGSYAIVGRVELSDGAPARGAHVSTGWMTSEVDADGRFVLDLEHEPSRVAPEPTAPRELVAARAGSLPARLALPSMEEARENGWPEDIVLRLEGEPLRIRGRVEDETGAPIGGVTVRALDVAPFGLVRGQEARWMVRRTLEEMSGGGEVQTNAEGEFVLAGLLEREYRLEAMWRPSLLTAVTAPVAAGDDGALIVLDRSALGRIAGRIVDRAGEGIEGVRISVSANREGYLEIGKSTLTDVEGRFALDAVTTTPPFLRLEGDPIVPELFRELPEGADLESLELRVGRRCYMQVDWEGWSGGANELVVVDEAGDELEMMNLEGNSVTPVPSIRISKGLSRVVALPDTATHAVLRRAGEEVRRIPLQPVPGELELLRP